MGDAKKILGYVAIAAAIVLTIFAPAGMSAWAKLAYFGSVLALSAGGSMLLNQVAKKEMAEQLARAQSVTAGLQANTRSSQVPIPVIYGWQLIGGNYLYMKPVGANNNELHCVLGLCEGEIDTIEKMYFGDTLVWDRTGALKTAYFFNFEMAYRLGTNSQAVFSQVQAVDSDFEDTYPNTAVVYLKLVYDQNLFQGVPQVNFIIRGRKVYDPRDLSTKWTQNGVLQLRDILTDDRFGAGIPETKIDDIAIGEAANYADQVVTRTTPLSVSEFLRYGWADIHQAQCYGVGSITLPRWGPICPGTLSIGGLGYDDGAGNITGGGFAGTINYGTNLLTLTAAPPFPFEEGMSESAWWITYRDGWQSMDDYLLYAPIVPGSISFSSADETVADNGLGVLTGSLGGSGTINYTTGRMIFTWKLAPPRYDPINVSYQTGSGPRFLTNYFAIDGGSVLDSIRSLLSQFRGFLIYSGGYYKVKIDKPETTVASFQSGGLEDGTNNIIDGSFSWQIPGISEIPTRIRAKWIDPMETWKVKDYLVDLPGADTDRRELTLELYSCNNIDVVERIARTHAALIGSSIKSMFRTNLQGLILEPGDKITVTHPAAGWTNKEFRVVEVSDVIASETVTLSLIEYNAANYIDDPQTTAIADQGTSPGTHPYGPPPDVTGLTLTEFWRQLKDGTWSSWIRVTFAEPSNYPYTAAYEVYLRNCSSGSNQYVMYGETRSGVYEIGPVKEATLWSVMIVIRTINGVRFYPSGAYAYIAPTGKVGLPTAPAFVTATCTFTDRVVLNWSPIPDTDLGNYELRTDTNWGNATNRLYLGKGTSFWMQAASASYTFYLKSIDTSGNYSSTFATKTLTNGAPTAPSVTTDYIGRDCIVKWGASPDLDFSKWILTIYSDAGRTTLKRTVEMQSPGFTYTYDQIRADFGGAGVPGTIYFRLVTSDIFGSTTTTDFSATQASPAIVQYDGGSVERVRIGDLGSGAYGARFKDSAGNITFEQGDTLKQQYMKIDAMDVLQVAYPIRWPFGTANDSGLGYSYSCFDGQVFLAIRNSNGHLWIAVQGQASNIIKDLTDIYTTSGTIHGLSFTENYTTYEISIILGTSNGFYYGRYSINSGTWSLAMTLVENNAARTHYYPMIKRYDSSYDQVVFFDEGNTNDIHAGRITKTTGAWNSGPTNVNYPGASGYQIIGMGGVGSSMSIIYRLYSTAATYFIAVTYSGTVLAGPTSYGTVGQANKNSKCCMVGPVDAGVAYNDTWIFFNDKSAGSLDTISAIDVNGTAIFTDDFYLGLSYAFQPITTQNNYAYAFIPIHIVKAECAYSATFRSLAFGMLRYNLKRNATLQSLFTTVGW